MNNGISTENLIDEDDQHIVDVRIDRATRAIVEEVDNGWVQHYGIMTCCIIDGEFVLASLYDVPSATADKLEEAAKNFNYNT